MNLFQKLEDKAKEVMKDPQKRQQIEKLAKEKGIPIEQAIREHFAKHKEAS
jgi:hypothetical protein